MLVLFETSAGYAIFKLHDEKKLNSVDNLYKDFETPEGASQVLKLKLFKKFNDTTEALAATTAAVEGKMNKTLKSLLKKLVVKETQEQLAISDAKLGNAIKDKFQISCVSNTAIQELMRCIRSQMNSLITGLPEKELSAMALGLAHSLSRYKLKFSPDKVDTMVVQAISLLDDLDKELNNYAMRAREWYGWHFPELAKIISDNSVYAKVVKLMGYRTSAVDCDFAELLPEEVEQELKEAAEISMGVEITDGDLLNIKYLCDQVIDISEYRAQLYDYIKNRMIAIAPNLTVLVGELVGARLIAHAGSLMNLAKHPSSTVQILGAEKALFRALKTKSDTPKYGLIYHASLVGQTNPKNKGKISRMLAAKSALAIRMDALGEDVTNELGIEHRAKLETRLRHLEENGSRRLSGLGKQKAKWEKYDNKSEVKTYQAAADVTLPQAPKKRKFDDDEDAPKPKKAKEEIVEPTEEQDEETPKRKKVKKEKHTDADTTIEDEKTPKRKKIKKEKHTDADTTIEDAETETPKSKKKKKQKNTDADTTIEETPVTSVEKKKKKKKQKQLKEELSSD